MPLSPEKLRACAQARTAIATIGRLVPLEGISGSQRRQRALMSAYNTLSKQSGHLGIGIAPLHSYDPERILTIAAAFKQQLEQRYPQ
jgi:hypothetical protein